MGQNSMTHCTRCDGFILKALVYSGKRWLEANYAYVNQLNVFPVPDGDTGTNMLLTVRNAYQEIATLDNHHAGQTARLLARGAMMGSRGNSGTILSQIFSGFADAIQDQESFDLSLATVALRQAAEKAYRGVQKPVEGTILSIIRELAEEAAEVEQSTNNLVTLLDKLVIRGWDAVERTPQALPILRQAGVVDSGGTGLMYLVEGMLKHIRGEEIALPEQPELPQTRPIDLSALGAETYNYDVQFILKGQRLDVARIRADIEAMGDSGVITGDADFVKVHIHVDDPGVPLSYGAQLGVLLDVVVENMQEQFEARREPFAPPLKTLQAGEIGVVVVAAGRGWARVFGELGAAAVVDGGQTNNPSTEEILKAAGALPTDQIILLPNNKNIILTAQQAASSARQTIEVLPTTTLPQGIAAMLAYNPQGALSAVAQAMLNNKEDVLTAEITIATRSVELGGVRVREGQVIGLVDGGLRVAGETPEEVLVALLQGIDLEERELVTIYYGETSSPEAVQGILNTLSQAFDQLTFEAVYGGQPHYQYILGIE